MKLANVSERIQEDKALLFYHLKYIPVSRVFELKAGCGHPDVVCKKMLKISLNSQESTCAEVFFYLKVTPAQVFCNIFENTSFAEHFGWLLET